jgi:hypothetical protein
MGLRNSKSKISKLKLMNEELEIEENKFNQFKNQIKKENNRKKLKELGLTEEDDNSTNE